MKILLINETYAPDVVATAQQATGFANYLSAQGHAVSVLCSRRNYSDETHLHPKREVLEGVHVQRISALYFGRNNKFSRILNALFQNLSFVFVLLGYPRFDLVLVMTSPPMIPVVASAYVRLKGGRLIHWMMDLQPHEAVAAGWIAKTSLIYKILIALLKQSFESSAHLVVLDRMMRETIEELGIPRKKISVIPPFPQDEILEAIDHEQNPFRKQQIWKDKFVVMYSGNFSVCHPMETLLEAAYECRHYERFHFVFIGGGARYQEVEDFIRQKQANNMSLLPYQDSENLKYSLSAADVHMIMMGNEFPGIVHPCKIYNILSLGKPFVFVGPDYSHVADIMNDSSLGIRVNHGEVKKLVYAFKQLEQLPRADYEEIKRISLRYKNEHFNADRLMKQLWFAVSQEPVR